MSLKLKKIIENIVIKGLFPEAAYLYDKEKKHTFKTLDFDHTIWTNSETRGEIIRNGAFAILALSDDKVEFIDDTNGEIVSIDDFQAYDVQLKSDFEKDFIFGYKNATYLNHTFYMDIGYFSASEDNFIILKEQYENGRIIWVSSKNILFLKSNSVEFLDYNFDKLWDLSFDSLGIENVTDCIDYQDFIFIIGEEGRILQISRKSGEILKSFQNEVMGFYRNYFINNRGNIVFLGRNFYMEISSSDFKILKSINFADQNILVKNCSYSEENQCIYFFGYYGNTFPNLIGSFDLNSLSFAWTFILENKNSGNAFYKCPQNVGDYIAAIDGQNNLLIFEKGLF